MNCIIIDDEPLAREGMNMLIQDVKYLNLLGEFPNAVEAIKCIESDQVDLIFLDIEMPGINGLEFLKSLRKSPFVILTTAYPQYALEAFELDVIDYLVKPVRFERFFRSVQKVKEIYDLYRHTAYSLEDSFSEYAYIRSDRKIVKLYYKDICFIKGLKDYVIIHTKTDKYITALNVKTILNQLPSDRFARVSKSYIINVHRIKSISIDSINLAEHEIPLGNQYKESFLKNYIKDKIIARKA